MMNEQTLATAVVVIAMLALVIAVVAAIAPYLSAALTLRY